MRKVLGLVLCFVLLQACLGNAQTVVPTATTTKKPIRFGLLSADRALYQILEAQFEQENPNLDIQFVTIDNLLAGNLRDNDEGFNAFQHIMSQVDVAHLPMIPGSAMSAGLFADLQPLIDSDRAFMVEDFFPHVLEPGQLNGSLFVIPQTVSVSLLSYNKQLWQSYSLPTPDPDWRWRDLVAAAKQLTVRDGEQIIRYGLLDWGGSTLLQFALADAGVDLNQRDLRLDQSSISEVFREYQQLIDRGVIYNPYVANAQHSLDQVHSLILNGQAAIWPRPMFDLNTLSQLPDFEIGTLAYPLTRAALPQTAQGLVLSSSSVEQLDAWQWIHFVSQHTSQQTYSPSTLPARRTLATQSVVWQQFDPESIVAVEAWLNRPKPASQMNRSPIPSLLNTALLSLWQGNTIEQALREAQDSYTVLALEPTQTHAAVASPIPIVSNQSTQARAFTIRFAGIGMDQNLLQLIKNRFHNSQPDILVDTDVALHSPIDQLEADCLVLPPNSALTYRSELLDLQPLLDRDGLQQVFIPSLLQANQQEGRLYALPYQASTRTLKLQRGLIKEAELEVNLFARDHDRLLASAQALYRKDPYNSTQYGYALSGSMLSHLMFQVQRFGGQISSGSEQDLQAQFLDPGVVQAVQWYVDILKYSPHQQLSGYRYDSPSEYDLDVPALLHTRQIAIWHSDAYDSSQSIGDIQTIAPPLGSTALSFGDLGLTSLGIFARSSQQESCWQWLKFLSSDLLGYNNPTSIPARYDILDNPHYPYAINNVIMNYRRALEQNLQASIDYRNSPIDYYWFFQAVDRAIQGEQLYPALEQAQTRTNAYLDCMVLHAQALDCALQVDPEYRGWSHTEP
jgi:ABC-type glycerol-3-phosphate transport system substrate-binding protein